MTTATMKCLQMHSMPWINNKAIAFPVEKIRFVPSVLGTCADGVCASANRCFHSLLITRLKALVHRRTLIE
jgi:hypothetical protein